MRMRNNLACVSAQRGTVAVMVLALMIVVTPGSPSARRGVQASDASQVATAWWRLGLRLAASDGDGLDRFGDELAVDGATLVVSTGPSFRDDAAYIFTWTRWWGWQEVAKLTFPDPPDGGNVTSVAVDGETIVVAAIAEEESALHVFTRPASGWANATPTAKLTASDGNSHFVSVAIDSDTIVAGNLSADNNNSDYPGAVYIFTKPPGGWVDTTETAKLTSSLERELRASPGFGESVAIDDGTIVVGEDTNVNEEQGAAYVFIEPPGGWTSGTETAVLTHSDPSSVEDGQYDFFGGSVAIDGDTIVVGASRFAFFEDGTPVDARPGAAYVFTKPAGGWVSGTETAMLTPSDAEPNDTFGIRVAIADNTVIVGGPARPESGDLRGATYVFMEPAGGWTNRTETVKLTAPYWMSSTYLGESVAIDRYTIVAGASQTDVGENEDQGAVYLFWNFYRR